MLRKLAFIVLAIASVTAIAQVPIAPPRDGSHPAAKKWDPKLIKGREQVKPVHFNTATLPRGVRAMFGIPNGESFEKIIGEIYTPKPEDPTAPVTQLPSPTFGNDATYGVTNFEGIPQISGLAPPDPDAAVGSDRMVQVTNDWFRFSDLCGNTIYENSFASIVGGGWFLFDPKVVFDPWWGRWVMLIHGRSGSSSILFLIISDDSLPEGGWWTYAFQGAWNYGSGVTWSDYYDLGFGVDGLYLGGNQFRQSDNAFITGQVYTINKSEVYAAAGTTYYIDYPATNPDGSTFASPRIADMHNGAGPDVFVVNSREGGGTRVTLRTLTAPFGAHTWTAVDVPTGAYSLAPAGFQPGGAWAGTFGCRLMNAVCAYDYSRNKWNLWTGMNAAVGGTWGHYIMSIEPFASTLNWNTTVWYGGGWNTNFPSVSADYRGNSMWAHSVANNSNWFPTFGWYTFADGVLDGAAQPGGGQAFYGTQRWGDYFGGQMDWGDYYAQGVFGKNKLWAFGEKAGTSGAWKTHAAAALVDGLPGSLAVDAGDPMYYGGVGGASGLTYTWNISNGGESGYHYRVYNVPNWLDVTSASEGTLYAGWSTSYSVISNANADALPFGLHTASIVFENCYDGSYVVRTFNLSLGEWTCPVGYYIYEGTDFLGGLSDVCGSDDQYFGLLNDDTTLTTDLYFWVDNFFDNGQWCYYYIEASSGRPGLAQTIDVWDFNTGWYNVGGGIAPIVDTTWASGLQVNNGNNIFVYFGTMYGRIRTLPINDEDPSQDGWPLFIDWVGFWEYP